jgi:hypothetical protein
LYAQLKGISFKHDGSSNVSFDLIGIGFDWNTQTGNGQNAPFSHSQKIF